MISAATTNASASAAKTTALFFLLAVVHLIELDSAFTIAKWGGLGLIGFYGYWAARFSGAPVPRALVRVTRPVSVSVTVPI